MMELIDRQALIADYRICGVCNNFESCNGYVTMCDSARMRQAINEAPTIEPEVRHGRWIERQMDLICSVCKWEYSDELRFMSNHGLDSMTESFAYCPHCGADLREGGADNG